MLIKMKITIIAIFFALLLPQAYIASISILDKYRSDNFSIKYPALPLIANEIMKIRPVIGGGLTVDTLQDICALAQKKISTEDVIVKLIKENKDIDVIRKSSLPDSLLVNDNQRARQIICASYVSNIIFQPIEIKLNEAESLNGTNDKTVNNKALTEELMTKLAAARANSEIFAFIAGKLSTEKKLTLIEYQKKIRELFSDESGNYLKMVSSYYNENINTSIGLNKLSSNEVDFYSNDWHYLKNHASGVVLKRDGIYWYGGNYILGNQFYLNVLVR